MNSNSNISKLFAEFISGSQKLTDDELISLFRDLDENKAMQELFAWHMEQSATLTQAAEHLEGYEKWTYRPVKRLNTESQKLPRIYQLAARSASIEVPTQVEIATFTTHRSNALVRIMLDRTKNEIKVFLLDSDDARVVTDVLLLSLPSIQKTFLGNKKAGFSINLSSESDKIHKASSQLNSIFESLLIPETWQHCIIHQALYVVLSGDKSDVIPTHQIQRNFHQNQSSIEFIEIKESTLASQPATKPPADQINLDGNANMFPSGFRPTRVASLHTGEIYMLGNLETQINTTQDAVQGSWAFFL